MNFKIILFLFFSICFSKEIFVFNEELLIVFSFLVFLFLVYSLISNQVGVELDLRANNIKQEFDFYVKIHKDTLNYLLLYYNKQKCLSVDIDKAFLILKKDTCLVIQAYSNLVLKFLFFSFDDKFKKILSLELKLYAFIQNEINIKLYDYLLLTFKKKTCHLLLLLKRLFLVYLS